MTGFMEQVVEDAAIEWLKEIGYTYSHGGFLPRMANGEIDDHYGQVFLEPQLRQALAAINPSIPAEALDDAFRKATRSAAPELIEDNRLFHRMLVDGVDVEYTRPDGSIAGDKVWLVDFENVSRNSFLAVNQFTVIENKHNRRPDIVIFINGLPLAVIELKNAVNESTTIVGAYNQLQTYKKEIPSLFRTNGLLVISDGIEARAGSLTADRERFAPWRTIDGIAIAPKGSAELETLIKGVFAPRILLDLIRNFVVFEADKNKLIKKIAAYHQYHAVNKAVECTVEAASPNGNKRAGVIWHTQGSGKSLSMAFYAGKVIQTPAMENPTLVVLTDRNDLDDQLFGTFTTCQDLLRQTPVQARDRKHLRELLSVASGGVIFTTIQKFAPEKGEAYPLLSDRRNIVVVADEAHRSQYDFIDGFARHMRDGLPKASFIGFTGTPIELSDKDTYAVFGENIHTYDIQQAVEDGATVRIYYESRLAKIELNKEEQPHLDEEFEEVTEGEEVDRKDKLKSKWARLEALVGAEKRVELIAKDIVEHFERRREGKPENIDLWRSHQRKLAVILEDSVKNHRSDAVSWILYLCLIYDHSISEDTAKRIIETTDCISITLLYLSSQHNDLVEEYANKLIANYSSVSPPFELDKQWLLTYQLFLDEKIGNPYPTDDAGYKTFEVLKKNKVSFIRGIKKADTKEIADPVHVNSKVELVGETV